MSRNMSNVDRGFRSLLVAPAAIVIAILAGPLSLVGVVLVALDELTGPPAAQRPTAALVP